MRFLTKIVTVYIDIEVLDHELEEMARGRSDDPFKQHCNIL